MARQRFIWPALWDDPDLGRVSHSARLLYIACFSNADDEGRLIGEPAHLRSIAFRYDDLTLEEVLELRTDVAAACKNFVVYVVDAIEYIVFHNWSEFQKPKYPKLSKHPKPPKPALHKGSDSGKASESLGEASGTLPGQGWVGLGSTPLPPQRGGSLRAAGQNPRARTEARKRQTALVAFVRAFINDYSEEAMLEELTQRGCRQDEALDLLAAERATHQTEVA